MDGFNYTSLITDYWVHSYLYYQLDESIISDPEFDDLCKTLHDNFEEAKLYDQHNL